MRIFLLLLLALNAFAQKPADLGPILDNLKDSYDRTDPATFTRDFSPALKEANSEKILKGFFINVLPGWGHWKTTGAVAWKSEREAVVRVDFEKANTELVLRLNAEGKVEYYKFNEIAVIDFASPPQASMYLRFPLKGQWLVLEGGDTAESNRHHARVDEAFALDLVKVADDGSWSTGKESTNEQFATYGQEILNPVVGRVIQITDNIPENAPGKANAMAPEGNALAIRYAQNEYVIFEHMQAGSFSVKPGHEPAPGQVLGRAGNSGDSLHPIVTVNVMDNVLGQKGKARKFGFACVEWFDGQSWQKKTNYFPVKGDRLRPCTD